MTRRCDETAQRRRKTGTWRGLAVGAAIGWAIHALVATAQPPPSHLDSKAAQKAPTLEQIEDWVNELGAEDFDRREAAFRQLVDAGSAAIPTLQAAARRSNLEIRWRARRALRLCEWGIHTRLERVTAQFNTYTDSDSDGKLRLLREWARIYGRELVPVLVQVCLRESDRQLREQAFMLLNTCHAPRETMLELAEAVAAQDSGAMWAFRALARLYHEQGQEAEALNYLHRIVAGGRIDYETHALLAEIYTNRGEWRTAATHHQHARDVAGPEHRLKHVRALAQIFLQLGEPEKAGAALETLVNEDRQNPDSVLMLLDFYFAHDMIEKATPLAEWAFEQWPNDRRLEPRLPELLTRVIDAWWDRGAYHRLPALLHRLRDILTERGEMANPMLLLGAGIGCAWAYERIGRGAEAQAALREFSEKIGDDRNMLIAVWRAAERMGYPRTAAEIRESAAQRHGHDILLAFAKDALDKRDREQAKTWLTQFAERKTNPSWELLAETIVLWDAIGDAEAVGRAVERLRNSPGFSTLTALEVAEMVYHPATALAVLEAAYTAAARTRDFEAGRNYVLALLNFKRYADALTVGERVLEWADNPRMWYRQRLEDAMWRCRMMLGKLDDVRSALREKWLQGDVSAGILLGEIEFAAGNLDRARQTNAELHEKEQSRITSSAAAEMAWRFYDFDRLAELLDTALDEATARQFVFERAMVDVANGELDAARQRLLRVIAADESEREVAYGAEFSVLSLLLALGETHAVAAFLKERADKNETPMPGIFGVDRRDTNHAHTGFQRTIVRAMVAEQRNRPASALRDYLFAWRQITLHYHAELVRRRLPAVVSVETAKVVRDELADELARTFGPEIRRGELNAIRHSRREKLRVYAHALALSGELETALQILREIVGHGMFHDLDYPAQVVDLNMSHMRGYGMHRIVDVALELALWLLRPETIPGIVAAQAAVAPEVADARAAEAFDLCLRLSAKNPNDMRVQALLAQAARRAGKTAHPAAIAASARLSQIDILDEEPDYVAAYHFTVVACPDLAVPAYRRLLAVPSVKYYLDANAEEYLGRVLFADPATRAEACRLFADSNERMVFTNWHIDEENFCAAIYEAKIAAFSMQTALAAGNTSKALEAARLAALYAPEKPAFQLDYARLLAASDQPATAQTRLQMWVTVATLRLRQFPGDRDAKEFLDAVARIPGVAFPAVPEVE